MGKKDNKAKKVEDEEDTEMKVEKKEEKTPKKDTKAATPAKESKKATPAKETKKATPAKETKKATPAKETKKAAKDSDEDSDDDEEEEKKSTEIKTPVKAAKKETPKKKAAEPKKAAKDESEDESEEEEEKPKKEEASKKRKTHAKTGSADSKKAKKTEQAKPAKKDSDEEDEDDEEEEEKDKKKVETPAPTPTPAAIVKKDGKKTIFEGSESSTAKKETPAGGQFPVFVGNLPWRITESELKEIFPNSARIELLKEGSGKFSGVAQVDFSSTDDQNAALEKEGQEAGGRAMKLSTENVARGKPSRGGSSGGTKFTVFVGRCPDAMEDSDVYELFKGVGEVTGIRWLFDKETGDFKGCGFVDFSTQEAVDKAVEIGQNARVKGKLIRVDHTHQN